LIEKIEGEGSLRVGLNGYEERRFYGRKM